MMVSSRVMFRTFGKLAAGCWSLRLGYGLFRIGQLPVFRTAGGFAKQLRSRVFRHVENFSLQEFDKLGTASLITRTTNDITQVQNVLTMMLRMMIMAPMMCIGGIFMAVSQDAKLSTIFLVVLPVLAGAIALIGAKGLPLFKQIQKAGPAEFGSA